MHAGMREMRKSYLPGACRCAPKVLTPEAKPRALGSKCLRCMCNALSTHVNWFEYWSQRALLVTSAYVR